MKKESSNKYWEKHWENIKFEIAPQNHPIRKWLEKEVSKKPNSSCFEIGCYPGKFLAIFGEKEYKLNGIDFFMDMNAMLIWLKNKKYKIGNFYSSDFISLNTSEKYDIVCSFGFIEHFNNYEEIIKKHIKLAKNNGNIIIEVPNLKSPLYYFLYKIFEPQILENHLLEAMSLKNIKNILKKEECNIKTADYIGDFYFRFVTKHNNFSIFVAKIINLFKPITYILPKSICARYIGVIATKNQTPY